MPRPTNKAAPKGPFHTAKQFIDAGCAKTCDDAPGCCDDPRQETLRDVAARTSSALDHAHSVLDGIENTLYGPRPCDPSCANEPSCIEDQCRGHAESSVRLAARLEHIRERLS